MGLIDLHCHLLPGIDDGPADMEGSLALARALVRSGVVRVAATPHVNPRHGNDPGTIADRREELRSVLARERIDLLIEQGAEISAPSASDLTDDELRQLTLGGGDWLLIEPPARASAFEIHAAVHEIQSRGFRVLLAHPERNPSLQADLDLVGHLVSGGVRTQVTAEALTGRYGTDARSTAREMFDRRLVHSIASDAHHATERPPGLEHDLKTSGHGDLIGWLCRDMPAWILDGGDEPSRPAPAPRGLFRRLRGRR